MPAAVALKFAVVKKIRNKEATCNEGSADCSSLADVQSELMSTAGEWMAREEQRGCNQQDAEGFCLWPRWGDASWETEGGRKKGERESGDCYFRGYIVYCTSSSASSYH